MSRQGDLAKIHIAKKELKMQESDYRQMLARVAQSDSSGSLDFAGRQKVIAELKRLGWKPRSNGGKPKKVSAVRVASHKRGLVKKICAIWITMAEAGVVHDRSEAAMLKFCYPITGVARLDWAEVDKLVAVVERLKKWAQRERVVLEAYKPEPHRKAVAR